jgi:NADPH:quinone reductase
MRVMLKRLTITGSTLRIRSQEVKSGIARQIETNVLPLFADGSVKAVIDSTFPLIEAAKAHERMESSQHIGKIVLSVFD